MLFPSPNGIGKDGRKRSQIRRQSLGGTRGRSYDDLYTLKVYFIKGRRAFSQPEGLFEWDIDAFDIRCKLYNYRSRNIY